MASIGEKNEGAIEHVSKQELVERFRNFLETYKRYYKAVKGVVPHGGEGYAHQGNVEIGDHSVYHAHRVSPKTKEADSTGTKPYINDIVLIGKKGDTKAKNGISVDYAQNTDCGDRFTLYTWKDGRNYQIGFEEGEANSYLQQISQALRDKTVEQLAAIEKRMQEELANRGTQSAKDAARIQEEIGTAIKAMEELGL